MIVYINRQQTDHAINSESGFTTLSIEPSNTAQMDKVKAPIWFIIIAIVALLWNSMGTFMFITDVTKTPEDIAAMDAAMQPFYQNVPLWNWLAYGLAVFAGLLGSIGLLMKRKWANKMFVFSLIGILIQNFFSFVVDDAMEALDNAKYVMPTLVIGIGIGLLFLSKKGIQNRWLN